MLVSPAYLVNGTVPAMLDRIERRPDGTPYSLGTSTPMFVHEAYMNGFADAECGHVDAIGGHWYRAIRYVVQTDYQGFTYCFEYATWMDAEGHLRARLQADRGHEPRDVPDLRPARQLRRLHPRGGLRWPSPALTR